MKTAKYRLIGGKEIEVEYDPNAPCIVCEQPVIAASMGGTAICPWCDCGNERPDLTQDEIAQLIGAMP